MNCTCGAYVTEQPYGTNADMLCMNCGRVWKQTMNPTHIVSQHDAIKALIGQLDSRIAALELASNLDGRRILALEALVKQRLDPDLILEAFAKNLKADREEPAVTAEDIPF